MASRHLVPASYHVKAAAPLPPWLMSGFLSRILQQTGRAASRGGQWAGRQAWRATKGTGRWAGRQAWRATKGTGRAAWRATKGTGRAVGRMLKTPEVSGGLAIGGGAAAAQKLLFNRSNASSPATSPPAPAADAVAAPPVSQTTVPPPPGGSSTESPAAAKARAWGETVRQYARPLAPYAPWLLGGALTGAGLYGLYHLLNRKSPDEQGEEKAAMAKLAGYPRMTGFLIACGELQLDDAEIAAGLTKVAAVDRELRAELTKLSGLLGDMGSNAWRFSKGLAGSLAGGVGTVAGAVGKAVGVPYADTVFNESSQMARHGISDMGKSLGFSGLNATRSQPGQGLHSAVGNQLNDVRNRPGVTPTAQTVSRIGETTGTLAAAAIPAAATSPVWAPAAGTAGRVGLQAARSIPQVAARVPGVGRAGPALKKLYDYGGRGLTGVLATEEIFQPLANLRTGPAIYDGKVVGEGTVIPTSFSGAYDKYWVQPAARKQIDTQNAQIAALEELIPTLSPEDQQAVQIEWLRRKGEVDARFAPGTPEYKAEIDAQRASLSNWVRSLQAAASQSSPAAPAVDTPIESPASGAQTNPAAVSNEVAGGGPAPAAAPGIDPEAALKNPDGSPKPHQQVVVEGQKAKQEAVAAGKANPEVADGVLKETETGEIGPFSMQGLINWASQLDAKVEELLPAWGNLDIGAKVALGLGLSLGTISLLSAIAGEGGLWGLLGSLLGFGVAGGIAAYGGAFGETPRAFLQGLLRPPVTVDEAAQAAALGLRNTVPPLPKEPGGEPAQAAAPAQPPPGGEPAQAAAQGLRNTAPALPEVPGGEPAQATAQGLRNTAPAMPKATAEPATTPDMAKAMQDVAVKVPDVVNRFAGAGGDPEVFDSPEDVKALIQSWATPWWLGGSVSDADMQRVVQALDPAVRQQLVQRLQTESFPGRDKLIQMLQAG